MIQIQENILLKEHTTFKIGGPAGYFCVVNTLPEIQEALDFATKNNIDFFILAGGSNIIVSDQGYQGLVIKLNLNSIDMTNSQVVVGSSVVVNQLIDTLIENSLSGLQWAGGLPGTIGGAIRGNAGAFGGEIKDIVKEVTSIDSKGQIIKRDVDECRFTYRSSIFKHSKEIIIEATLSLRSGDPIILKKEANEHRDYRVARHPIEFPSAGSIFKNVAVTDVPKENLDQFKTAQKNDPFPVIPTAFILSEAGLKGYTIGGAQVSEKHPNYIINVNNATAQDVVGVIQNCIAQVGDKFGIRLEVEPQLLGFETHYPWESN